MTGDARDFRRQQLEVLAKTLIGQDRIYQDYVSARGRGPAVPRRPIPEKIEAILDAEFPHQGDNPLPN
jgi:hypothetical protein